MYPSRNALSSLDSAVSSKVLKYSLPNPTRFDTKLINCLVAETLNKMKLNDNDLKYIVRGSLAIYSAYILIEQFSFDLQVLTLYS